MFLNRQRLGVIILFLSDIVILFLISMIAVLVRNIIPEIIPSFPRYLMSLTSSWWFFPIWIVIMAYEGAYTKKFTFWDEVKLIWRVSFFSTIAILTIVSLGKLGYATSRTLVLIIGSLSLIFYPPFRLFIKHQLLKIGLLKSKVLILGTNQTASQALTALKREPNLGYEVVGFLDADPSKPKKSIHGIKVHCHFNKIDQFLKKCDVQNIVFAAPEMDKNIQLRLLSKLQHKVQNILYIPDFAGMAVLGTELRHFFHDQFLAVEIKNNLAQPLNFIAKKIFDYFCGFVFFLLLIIPTLIISAIIKFTSPGPAIYKHKRIGKNGKPFLCYKFRTMHKDSEEKLKLILEKDADARNEWNKNWKLKNDPRITKIGKFLRSTSLDELPQIFNVLKGEMSLVGPRPVVQHELDTYYKEDAEFYYSVLPGITGLWQVSGRSNTSYDSRVSLDAWYVRNWNAWLDIVILMKTAAVVLRKEGAV